MSQHNIVGSEAFTRGPSVIIRKYKAGGMRRRRSKTIATFIAGAGAMLVVGMSGLYLWNPASWSEASLALTRAGLPLALLAVILISWLVERLPIDPDLVS